MKHVEHILISLIFEREKIPRIKEIPRINAPTPIKDNFISISDSAKKEKPPSIIQSIKHSGLFSKIFMSQPRG